MNSLRHKIDCKPRFPRTGANETKPTHVKENLYIDFKIKLDLNDSYTKNYFFFFFLKKKENSGMFGHE